MKKETNKRRNGFTILGYMFLSFAICLSLFFIKEDRDASKESEELLKQFEQQSMLERQNSGTDSRIKEQQTKLETKAKSIDSSKQTEEIEKTNEILGILEIPKLERILPVWKTYSEEQLKTTVCRYGEDKCQKGQLIIAGHSYKSHFSRLGTLQKGDKISLTYANYSEKKKDSYVVSEVTEIDGTDVDGLFAGEWDLTLFTCTFGGKQRVIVRCIKA